MMMSATIGIVTRGASLDLPAYLSSYYIHLSGSFWLHIDHETWKMLSKSSEVILDAMSLGSKVIKGQILKVRIYKF